MVHLLEIPMMLLINSRVLLNNIQYADGVAPDQLQICVDCPDSYTVHLSVKYCYIDLLADSVALRSACAYVACGAKRVYPFTTA